MTRYDFEHSLSRDSRIRRTVPKCVRKGVSAEECCPPPLQVGDADERSVRPRGHGGNTIGGSRRSKPDNLAGPSNGWGFGVFTFDEDTRASSRQVGGSHYSAKAIQPSQYNHANGLGWCEGNVVKYITRHADKGGAEDVRKAMHYCALLLEWEYGETE